MTENTAPAAPKGWYPVPEHPETVRYWDGSAWTTDTMPAQPPTPTAFTQASSLLAAQATPNKGLPGSGYEGLTWNGKTWVDEYGRPSAPRQVAQGNQSFKLTNPGSGSAVGKRVLISLLLTPVALAIGLVVYFVVGMVMGIGAASSGAEVTPGTYSVWLLISVGGTIAATWAIVWAAVKS